MLRPAAQVPPRRADVVLVPGFWLPRGKRTVWIAACHPASLDDTWAGEGRARAGGGSVGTVRGATQGRFDLLITVTFVHADEGSLDASGTHPEQSLFLLSPSRLLGWAVGPRHVRKDPFSRKDCFHQTACKFAGRAGNPACKCGVRFAKRQSQ